MTDQDLMYDLSEYPSYEGPPPSGLPHVAPGSYAAAVKKYEHSLITKGQHAGRKQVTVEMTIVGGIEDGTVLRDFFGPLNHPDINVRKRPNSRLKQFFEQLGVLKDGKVDLNGKIDKLVGRRCYIHVVDRPVDARAILDENGQEQIDPETGEVRKFKASTTSRIVYYERIVSQKARASDAVTQTAHYDGVAPSNGLAQTATIYDDAPLPQLNTVATTQPVEPTPQQIAAIAAAAAATEQDDTLDEWE